MSAGQLNALRMRAVLMSRAFKNLFAASPASWWRRLLALVVGGPAALRRWCYRTVFTDAGARRIAADHVLADLREFCFARASTFDKDPLIAARRQGRRDVWLRISNYLNLDEAEVQKLMEIDDGY